MSEVWAGYAAALDDLHTARSAVTGSRRGARSLAADRDRRAGELGAALQEQAERLSGLAKELGEPLDPSRLDPLPGAPPLPWEAGEADGRARVRAADEAIAEARRVGRLPQFLPQWSSQFGRAAVVYAGFSIPAIALVTLTWWVHDNQALLIFLAVVWPLVTAIGGAIVLGRVARPRLERDESEQLLERLRPPRRYPWLGVIICLGGSMLTQWLMESLLAVP
jgi:hypothetical protein